MCDDAGGARTSLVAERMLALASGLNTLYHYVPGDKTLALSTHHQYILVDKVTDLPTDVADFLRAIGWGTWSDIDPDGKGQTWGFPTC